MNLQPIRILLVEDNPGDARLLRESLREVEDAQFELAHVDRLDAAFQHLLTAEADVVLLDLSLPDSTGIDTIRRLHLHAPQLPIVVLTGMKDENQGVRAVQEGAQDYLVKGFADGNLLRRAMRYAIERHRILGELESARRQEHFVATHDLLTRLPNRQLFHDRLGQALAEARRHGSRAAVLFIDLDRFKFTNDTFGHAVGDRLLQAVAERLRGCVRETDVAARLGGDEFTVILNNVAREEDVSGVAQKVLDQLSEPFEVDGNEFFITASIGISMYPCDGGDTEALVKNADTAMYRAKSTGKNRFQFYLPEMNERALERMDLERSLRTALDRDEFVLYYQPQVDIRTGCIVGMEALIRWEHPRLGLLTPGRFVGLAEETGLIVPIGDWVLRTACAQVREWLDQGLPQIPVAVNISARQFQHHDPVAAVRRALEETRLDPEFLELELTESVLMNDATMAAESLLALKRLGTRISIDDFGTGYSSLAYLTRFPLEKLKIDRAFIQTITLDRQDRAVTSAIIALAHSLDLKPVAEGVETVEQLNTLRALNCDRIQGYFFSKPLTPSAATRLLVSRQERSGASRIALQAKPAGGPLGAGVPLPPAVLAAAHITPEAASPAPNGAENPLGLRYRPL